MKKTAILLLSLSLLLGALAMIPAWAADTEGMSFTADKVYRGYDSLASAPLTIEATVCYPVGYSASERGGVICGNYYYASTNSLSIEVYSNGVPRVYFIEKSGAVHDWKFDKVNLYTGEWVHLAIVFDHATDDLKCYVNGELKQTLARGGTYLTAPTDSMVIGGDLRDANAQYFKGQIKNISMYSDVRTDAEIAGDAKATTPDKDNLMVAYDLTGIGSTAPETLSDVSGNGNDASYIYTEKPDDRFFTDKEPVTDYAYSFAVVGDTQKLSLLYPDKIGNIYDWIVANKTAKKIEYVIGLGDITENNTDGEWANAVKHIGKMNGVVPYSLIRGNHDLYNPSGVNQFNKYTPQINYEAQIDGCYNGQTYNSYKIMKIGQLDYLFLHLDYGADDGVLAWAGKVISDHPNHNVILSTHAYLYRDGSTLDETEVCPPTKDAVFNAFPGSKPNNGDHMWDKLVSKHENIVLVLCGHDPCDTIVTTQTKGEKGNTVTQMLIDPQDLDNQVKGGTGMVAMLYFSEDGSEIQVEYYSTVKEAFFLQENQFTVKIDTVTVSDEPPAEEPTDTPTDQPTDEPTDAPTDESTDVPTEDATETLTQPEAPTDPVTVAPTADAGTDAPDTDEGCSSVIGASAILGALAAAVVLAVKPSKKSRDE